MPNLGHVKQLQQSEREIKYSCNANGTWHAMLHKILKDARIKEG